jgi:hypothetical protein
MTVAHDPPDLGADFPDAFRSLRPVVLARANDAGFPLVGLSKERPSIVPAGESASRRRPAFPRGPSARRRAARSSFGMGTPVPIRVPPAWSLTTSTVCSSPTLRPFSGRCRSWGSPRFLLSRNRTPRDAPAALRSLPSADSDGVPDESGPPWARVTAPTVSGPRVHREPCPLALSPRVSTGPGLEALLHRRVRCAAGRCRSAAPGAPLGLSGSVVPRGRPARDEHAGITSKTTPKSGSSV